MKERPASTLVRELYSKPDARLIAFYLPQFHPIPENDIWWGKGFTEWTNVAKATPLFPRHYQPHIPADLGFYDLRVPDTRAMQAEMAKEFGLEGFCYYHYWFGGKQLLERPLDEVLASGEPKFPFCICWANQSWTGIWHGAAHRMLIEQTYPGYDDHEAHFYTVLKAFSDPRYLCVDGKPVFLIYRPWEIPETTVVLDFWRELAARNGLKGLHIVGILMDGEQTQDTRPFDGFVINHFRPQHASFRSLKSLIRRMASPHRQQLPQIYSYKDYVNDGDPKQSIPQRIYPQVIPNWDNTPRCGHRGVVLHASNPELFRIHLRRALARVKNSTFSHRLVFVKSWNEWAEGNHLEPDLRFGKQYLHVIKDEVYSERLHHQVDSPR